MYFGSICRTVWINIENVTPLAEELMFRGVLLESVPGANGILPGGDLVFPLFHDPWQYDPDGVCARTWNVRVMPMRNSDL